MSFPLIGHLEVQDRLNRAMASHHIPSAYLFLGPSGLGKSTLARKFAQQLNCTTQNNCGACESCQLFTSGNHPDFLVIEPDGRQIKIAQIQGLISHLALKPRYAKKRVVLVRRADKLGIEASNSFLKILEEPPLNSLLILTADDESSLLETLVSRCQRVPFGLLNQEELGQILATYEDPVDPQAQELILAYSEGRIRADLIEKSGKLLGLESQVAEMMEAPGPEQWVDRLDWLASLVKQDLDKLFLEFLARWFRDLSFSKADCPEHTRRPLAQKHLAAGTNRLKLEDNLYAFDLVQETMKNLSVQGNRLLGLERLFIKLKHLYFPGRTS